MYYTYLLLIEWEVPIVSYGPEFFSILMAQARSARAIRKKQGSVTYGTDRANEVNKMFIIRLLPLPILIFTFGRSILKRARKFPRFSLTHVVSVGF